MFNLGQFAFDITEVMTTRILLILPGELPPEKRAACSPRSTRRIPTRTSRVLAHFGQRARRLPLVK